MSEVNGKIKIAIVGVGNCASALIQGIEYYSKHTDQTGIMHDVIGGYKISDLEVVAAFDVDQRKVGKSLNEAIFAEPNCALKFSEVPRTGVIVKKGEILDGIAPHMTNTFLVDEQQVSVDIVDELVKSGAEIVINYLPVGSAKASRFYAEKAIEAHCAFINAIPEFICSSEEWSQKFAAAGLPCAGDDIKSQVGATILHRVIAKMIEERGHTIGSTYQLNIGGNTDFENMQDESRLASKRKSKTNAVVSILEDKNFGVRIGPSDYVKHLGDNKVCYINFKGTQFGGVNYELDLKLSVQDSPDSAGVICEAIRGVKVALDRGLTGNINAVSAYLFKSPAMQVPDDQAKKDFEDFFNG